MNKLFVVVALILLSGCAAVPKRVDNPAVTESEIKLCFFADKDVGRAVAEKMVGAWNKNEGAEYNLPARVSRFEQADLNGASPMRLMQQPASMYLKPGCDRNVGLVGRNATHTVFHTVGLLLVGPLPEILGGAFHSHMTAVAKFSTANQLIKPPTVAFRHELEHTLGCGHSTVFGRDCAKAVRDLKAAQISDFFPAVIPIHKASLKHFGGVYTLVNRRDNVNDFNHAALEHLYAESQKPKRGVPKHPKGKAP